MSLTTEDYAAWVRRYFNHPVEFVRDVLDADPYPWQRDFLIAVARGDRNIGIASGHRVGKSTGLGWASLWYMMTRNPFKIGVTAPTSGQLEDAMFAELRTWLLRMEHNAPGLAGILEAKSDRVDLVASRGTSFLVIKTGRVEQPEALAGLHSANTLLLGDEASGIPDLVFDSATSSMAADNAQMILAGNPLRATGYFAKGFAEWRDHWTTFTVSSVDCPNVSRAWIEEKKVEYGEESNAYRARVLGLFPLGDDDTIIPLEFVTSAVGREVVVLPKTEEWWGLDVAELGSCVSALCRRRGKKVADPVEVFAGLEAMQLVGRVHALYRALPEAERPVGINVDGIGYGAGVASRLAELGLPAVSINVSETASVGDAEKIYANLRTELWYRAREWLRTRDACLPNDERLKSDLTKIRLVPNSGGRADKLRAESKLAMRKRGIRSPDTGDAFILTFAGDAVIASGSGFRKYRHTPIRRNIKGTSYTG